MLKWVTEERGSVLMEFIIVLPVYCLLLGYIFVVGELSLHSIRLSASGDRLVALSREDLDEDKAKFWRRVRRVLSPNSEAMTKADNDPSEDGLTFSYEGDLVYQGRASVSSFDELSDIEQKTVFPENNGFCTVAVAGRAKDDYTLSPVTRGFIAHWFYESERHVYDGEGMSKKMDRPIAIKDSVDKILDKDRGSLGRAEVRGNYYVDNMGETIRDYGYFSLRMNRSTSYRAQGASALAAGDWKSAAIGYEESEQLPKIRLDFVKYIAEDTSESSAMDNGSGTGGDAERVSYDFSELL